LFEKGLRENAPPPLRFCAPIRLCCALTICTRNRVSEAADLEEGLIAMQREYASEEARILRWCGCGAVYTWGYERAFENGLDSNWAAQGWRGISFGLISPMGNASAPVSQAPRSIWTVQRVPGHLARMLACWSCFVRMAAQRRVPQPA
jgi:hypothetical protein